ncbi:MAG: sterol desaturase family protein [Burkholderiaceae bacterium]
MSKGASQLFILGFTACMGVLYSLMYQHGLIAEILSLVTILTIGLAWALERVWPHRPIWNRNQGDLKGDIVSFAVVFVVLDGLLKYLAPIVLVLLLGGLVQPSSSIALWFEIIAVTLLIEFAAYASHWLHHRSKHLWTLHATHHVTQRLYSLNNFRFHPLNHVVNACFIVVPPLLIGFSPEAVLGYAALSMPVLIFQHANVDFRFGWLNYILNTNEVHRWHHSSQPEDAGRNLGRALVIWDHVFGTFLAPNQNRMLTTVGLPENERARFPRPASLFAQWRYPFTAACCSR